MHNRDTLALLPTGGGKSVCYQVPALMKEGFCLVISPLIALMQDQVARLKELDVPAASLHSGMHYNEVKRTIENAMHGAYKLLYISPERLQTDLFLDYLPELDISMIAVDEAHCVSQWGHDFRPDYLKIADIRTIFPDAPVLALTATATLEVQQDIAAQLKMFEGVAFRQSFARNNIFYEVRYSENKIADTAADINTTCSIIYCRRPLPAAAGYSYSRLPCRSAQGAARTGPAAMDGRQSPGNGRHYCLWYGYRQTGCAHGAALRCARTPRGLVPGGG